MNKKYLLLSTIMMAVLMVALPSYGQEKIIPASELPTEITSYISTHFPDNTITQVVKEREGFSNSYEIILSGNISLEFNRKKKIEDIDGNSQLPDSVIPEKIRQYVSKNYPNTVITDWKLDDKNQQIELDNGVDLEFNMDGDFLRIDS